MPGGASFGVLVVACDADLYLARGACASVRHFLGDTPICLILDGRSSARELEDTYGATIVRRADVRHGGLRERSFGFGVTKMIGLWEAPFETFLCLDADTIVWGDMRNLADFDRFDFVTDEGPDDAGLDYVASFYFDPERIRRRFPDFDPAAHAHRCVNTGAFFGRRDALDLDLYLRLLDLRDDDPRLFFPGEQGILNFMLLRALDAGAIRLDQRRLQFGAPWLREERRRWFELAGGEPRVVSDPAVLHWPGRHKPRVSRSNHLLSDPSVHFRLAFLQARAQGGAPSRRARIRLRVEDSRFVWRARRRRQRQRVSRLLGSVAGTGWTAR